MPRLSRTDSRHREFTPPDTACDGLAFEPHRARLLRIAYRMLGSRSEAEDVVQDAWLRWTSADRSAVEAPFPFLARIVTRLCLDQMKLDRWIDGQQTGFLRCRSSHEAAERSWRPA